MDWKTDSSALRPGVTALSLQGFLNKPKSQYSGIQLKDTHRLETCVKMIKADKGILLSRTTQHIEGKNLVSTNLEGVLGMLTKA
jgi:hypothetical protein